MADTPDPQELARRYLDLWQQHLTEAANDPALGAAMENLFRALPAASPINWPESWPGWPLAPANMVSTGDNTTPGPTAAAAAPDGGGDGFDKLLGRLESIEKRLDALEQYPEKGGKRAAKGSGKRRS